MSENLYVPEEWKASIEEDHGSAFPADTQEAVKDLFNRAAFDGERIIMTSGDASFAIVPIEDVLLLDAECL